MSCGTMSTLANDGDELRPEKAKRLETNKMVVNNPRAWFDIFTAYPLGVLLRQNKATLTPRLYRCRNSCRSNGVRTIAL